MPPYSNNRSPYTGGNQPPRGTPRGPTNNPPGGLRAKPPAPAQAAPPPATIPPRPYQPTSPVRFGPAQVYKPTSPIRLTPPAAPVGAGAAGAAAGGGGIGILLPALALAIPQVLLLDSPAAAPELMPPEPPVTVELPTFPFYGGQEPKVLYQVFIEFTMSGGVGAPDFTQKGDLLLYGPIVGPAFYRFQDGNTLYTITSGGAHNRGPYARPQEENIQNGYHIQKPAIKITHIRRVDGKPDIGGNPPPTNQPIYSSPGNPVGTPQPQAPSNAPSPATGHPQGQPLPQLQQKTPIPTPAPAPNSTPTQTNQPLLQPLPIGQPQPLPFREFQPLPFAEPAPKPGLNLAPPPAAEPTPAPLPTPTPNTNRSPTPFLPSAPFPPTILITPGGNPGPLVFQPNPTTGNPEPKAPPITSPTPVRSPDPEPTDLDKIRDTVNKLLVPIGITVTGIAALLNPVPAKLDQIKNQTDPNTLKEISKSATCETFQPGGCAAGLPKNAEDAAKNSANNLSKLDALNTLMQGADLGLLKIMDNKLGPQLPDGGISGFLGKFFKSFNNVAQWLHLDRLLNLLTFTTSLHNAYMLSSGLSQTLFSMVGNVLSAVGIKDAEGNGLNINAIVGRTIDNLLKSALGTETVDGIKKDWAAYNRIYQAGANIVSSFQSIASSIQNGIDVLGSYTGKIGNALKRFGVVGERAYGWMSENMNTRTGWLDRLEASVSSAQEITSNIDTVAGSVLSVQDTVKQLRTQQTEFETALKAVEPKPTTDNKPVQDKNDADKVRSQSASIALLDLNKPDE